MSYVNTTRATREASENQLFDSGYNRLNAMLNLGITTVEGKSGYGLDRDTEMKQLRVMRKLNLSHQIDIVSTFMGAHAFPEEWKGRVDLCFCSVALCISMYLYENDS